jgi:hypothetical protein
MCASEGTRVAVDTSHPDRPTIASLLARRLAADPSLQGRCPPEMEGNLRSVAQLHYESNRNLEDLAIITADFYEGLKNTTTPFHRIWPSCLSDCVSIRLRTTLC